MNIQFRTALILIIVAVLISSCTNPFHPNLRNVEQIQPVNNSPEAVLKTLELAYRQKNIMLFESCLAPDFRFELLTAEVSRIGIDWNNDGIKDSWWGYEYEMEFHRNLFTEGSSDGSYPPPDQINLTLHIPAQEQWESDTQVGHEDWIVIPSVFYLELLYSSSSSSLSSNGVARFYLKPVNSRWYIAIWRDESNI